MAIPKKLKGKLAIIALKEAEDNLDTEDEMEDDAEEMQEQCVCPKCHYRGPLNDFTD